MDKKTYRIENAEGGMTLEVSQADKNPNGHWDLDCCIYGLEDCILARASFGGDSYLGDIYTWASENGFEAGEGEIGLATYIIRKALAYDKCTVDECVSRYNDYVTSRTRRLSNVSPSDRKRIAANIRQAAEATSAEPGSCAEILVHALEIAAYDGDWPALPTAATLCERLADLVESGGAR